MKIEYLKSFERDLRKIRDKTLLNRLKAVLLELEKAEFLESISSVKSMKGYPEYFRIRIGDYRLGLKRTDNCLRIIRFLSRSDIYRKFP